MAAVSNTADAEKTAPRKVRKAELVLANYASPPLLPSGTRLGTFAQTQLADLLGGVYEGYYRSHKHVELSADDEAAFLNDGSSKGADCYGEMMPEGFLELLWNVGAQPGSRFYDLGAGTGKLPALAWFLGMRATGIELSDQRWRAACDVVEKIEALGAEGKLPPGGIDCKSGLPRRLPLGLDYVCCSLLDVDFSDADIIFVSSVMFTQKMVAKIARLARYMKPGSKVISYHNFGKLPKLGSAGIFPEFRELGECTVASSWKLESCWQVQEVIRGETELEQFPPHLLSPSQFSLAQRRMCGF